MGKDVIKQSSFASAQEALQHSDWYFIKFD
jgi:hypothetical protein